MGDDCRPLRLGSRPRSTRPARPPAPATSASRAPAETILEHVNAGLIDEFSIALSPRAVRLRNPPVRGRGRGLRGPGAGPRGADAAGDPPNLRSPEAVTVSTSALTKGPAPAPPVSRWRSSSSNDPTNQRVVISKSRDTPIHRS
jgi:hypothetical protein